MKNKESNIKENNVSVTIVRNDIIDDDSFVQETLVNNDSEKSLSCYHSTSYRRNFKHIYFCSVLQEVNVSEVKPLYHYAED